MILGMLKLKLEGGTNKEVGGMRLTKYWYWNLFDWNIITSKDRTSMMTRGNKRERHQAAQSRPKVHLQKYCKKKLEKTIFVFFHREISPMAEKTTSITVTWVSSRLWWTKPELHSVWWNVSKTASIGIDWCFTCITVKQPCTLILPIITWESF